MKEVLDELSKAGIAPVAQVGQIMVNATAGEEFQISGSPSLGDTLRADWRIMGQLDVREGTPALNVQLAATVLRPSGEPHPELKVDTVISAPDGHYVVLGVTPIESATSAFVVQISCDR